MGSLSLTFWPFAAAGAVCALGPLVIHLLNRRRFRVVEWAAMDYLRQALQRNRKLLRIRDILLLLLRTAAVLLFGLALARPFLSTQGRALDDKQPVHAILLIDNSFSMAYESLSGSLLDQAKQRAREFVEQLPAGSRVSLIPASGSQAGVSVDPFDAKVSALEALERIEVVDRTASVSRAANEALRALQAAPELAKRVVLITDQQAVNWDGMQGSDILTRLPQLQIVDVAPPEWQNSWIVDLRLQDGLADMETPATVVVTLAHRGGAPRRNLQVTLSLEGAVVGQKTVTLEPGPGTREVEFEVVFQSLRELPTADKPVFATLQAALDPDRLAADDQRFLAVPVVAALPVVFIDQYGPEQEDVIRGRLGETRHLRKLLAPRTSRSDAPRQLISARHVAGPDVKQETLADARLVVVAGLREPGELASLLREYVLQGGQLLIAAGAEFDPALWNAAAWNDGAGVLPLPLSPDLIGRIPELAGADVRPFHLSFDSLAGSEYFQLAGVGEAELRDLYAEPFFFQAVVVDTTSSAFTAAEEAAGRLEKSADKPSPAWLVWAAAESLPAGEVRVEHEPNSIVDEKSEDRPAPRPRVLASYDLPGQPPFLIAHSLGKGQVIFCSTGLLSSWNTLPKTNAVLIFDRLLRSMIEGTLPRRNWPATDRLQLPLPPGEQQLLVSLLRPNRPDQPEAVDVGYLTGEQRGVTLTRLLSRGVYRLTGVRPESPAVSERASAGLAWDLPLVINGPPEESDLTPLTRERFAGTPGADAVRWVGAQDTISLAGAAARGHSSWRWLIVLTLVMLLLEMSVLIWPAFTSSRPTQPAAA